MNEITGTKGQRVFRLTVYHVIVFLVGIAMLYPLIWMLMSSFKETNTIFTTAGELIPREFTFENYSNGWRGFANISFATFFQNSLFIAIMGTVGRCSLQRPSPTALPVSNSLSAPFCLLPCCYR